MWKRLKTDFFAKRSVCEYKGVYSIWSRTHFFWSAFCPWFLNLGQRIQCQQSKVYSTLFYFLEFAKVCELSTDFHFPNLEQQFMNIEQQLKSVTEAQRKHVTEDGDKVSMKSSGSSSSGETQVTVSNCWWKGILYAWL